MPFPLSEERQHYLATFPFGMGGEFDECCEQAHRLIDESNLDDFSVSIAKYAGWYEEVHELHGAGVFFAASEMVFGAVLDTYVGAALPAKVRATLTEPMHTFMALP